MGIVSEIKDSFKEGGTLTKLIYINAFVFLLVRLCEAFYSLSAESAYYPVPEWFSVPSNPARILLKPWTSLTYMFLHYDFLHLVSNLLCLYWFGRIFVSFFEGRQLVTVYVAGGLCGALFFVVGSNVIPALYPLSQSGFMLGASASVMAVLFAVTRYAPDFRVNVVLIGEVRLKYLALAYFAFDVISIPALQNAGGHLAHIGGAVLGFCIGYRWAVKGKPRATGTGWNPFRRKPKMTVVYRRRPMTDMEYNYDKAMRTREVDRILDKVKSSGYASLTSEEKKKLFDASKNL